MIFLMVGTHTKPFNRLLQGIDDLIGAGEIRDKVVAQIGNTDYKPKNYVGKKFFEEGDRRKLIAAADVIITHAGAGCIIDSLITGKPTIVFPRLRKFGEHTDDHQLEIAKAFGDEGKVVPVYDVSGIPKAINDVKSIRLDVSGRKLTERLDEYLKAIDKIH